MLLLLLLTCGEGSSRQSFRVRVTLLLAEGEHDHGQLSEVFQKVDDGIEVRLSLRENNDDDVVCTCGVGGGVVKHIIHSRRFCTLLYST